MLTRGAPFRCGPGPWPARLPFLFIGAHFDQFPAGDEQMGVKSSLLRGRQIGSDFSGKDGWSMYHGEHVPGFPRHPHSNSLTTITITLSGTIDHFDSMGNAGRYGGGDIQWASFSSGAEHSEMFPLINKDGPNPVELLQVWQLIPSKLRKDPMRYVMQWREGLGSVLLDASGAKVDAPAAGGDAAAQQFSHVSVISGSYMGSKPNISETPQSWSAQPESHSLILIITIPRDGMTVKLPPATSPTAVRTLYQLPGIGARSPAKALLSSPSSAQTVALEWSSAAELNSEIETVITSSGGGMRLMLLQAVPIGQQHFTHGPFVSYSPEEIRGIMREYQTTRFNSKWEGEDDQVHPRDQPRFSRQAGEVTYPPKQQ
jgi:redox-sensitive bicupin YhaK (pirin superfamily)